MGSYLNPNTMGFKKSLNSQIFIDKSMLISETNKSINSEQQFVCVSRPRRFGKSMAMKMLAAYYATGNDSHELFDDLKISNDSSFDEYINKYNVIWINMQEFLSATKNIEELIKRVEKYVTHDMLTAYPDIKYLDQNDFIQVHKDLYDQTGIQFVILIDEWDCLFREYKEDLVAQKTYLDFLRMWLKDQTYVALAYMTGILPIKKYGTHSALNMFKEYSMTSPGTLAQYFGFTEDEVKELCTKYDMSYEEAKAWYDGYELTYGGITYHMYNPKSVVEAMLDRKFDTYWNKTETYEALQCYILLDIDGLKEKILRMMTGEHIPVDTGTFVNDMTSFARADDVLTLLIHLGYLNYLTKDGYAMIPNREVSIEYANAVSTSTWSEVAKSVENSRKLLKALLDKNEKEVAAGIAKAHEEISILKYNDENSLSCCINLAFYFAKEYYSIIREMPGGKGFADIVLIPRKLFADKPAVVIELKVDKSARGAIDQIKNKNYGDALKGYKGSILLCGINYDRVSKEHTCVIESDELVDTPTAKASGILAS